MATIKLFTTQTVEGCPIENYYGVVTANQVAGTGFFSDLTASFSDVFGGNSGTYREQMNGLYADVVNQISNKASRLGANAIVGVTISYGSIPAKGMSMFLVSLSGTAVLIKEEDDGIKHSFNGEVSLQLLESQYEIYSIRRKLQDGGYLNEDHWKFLVTNKVPELADLLYEYYKKCKKNEFSNVAYAELGRNYFPVYLSSIGYEAAVELIYEPESRDCDLIDKCKLFSPKKILEYLTNGYISLALGLLDTKKQTYSSEDLQLMKQIINKIDNLPNTGKIEDVKGGMFSSGGKKFICECGEKNDPNQEFCSNCEKNIKGITKYQKEEIKIFTEYVNILEELFSKLE